jgi:hypothetical protein
VPAKDDGGVVLVANSSWQFSVGFQNVYVDFKG